MPYFKTIEDIEVWKDSIALVTNVYAITFNSESLKRDYGLSDQLRRSAVSIPSNIAEGFERFSTTEFIRFLYIAKGSSGELRTQLLITYNLEYINKDKYEKMNRDCVKNFFENF